MWVQDLQVWRARLNSKVGKVREEMDSLRDSMTTQVQGLRQELDDLQVQSTLPLCTTGATSGICTRATASMPMLLTQALMAACLSLCSSMRR